MYQLSNTVDLRTGHIIQSRIMYKQVNYKTKLHEKSQIDL